jgi:hypothetical protein
MEKKKIYTIIGVLAGAGLVYYFWKKNKSSESKIDEEKDDDKKEDAEKVKKLTFSKVDLSKEIKKAKDTPKDVQDKPKVKQLTAEELESKLQQTCGKKPLLKKNKKKYEQCRENAKSKLRSEGYISFSGEEERVVPSTFYSSFDSHLDLDL